MENTQQQQALGMATMLASGVVFALMASLLRYADHVDVYTSTFFRFVIGLAILTVAAMTNRISLSFTRPRMLFLRGLLGGVGTVIFYLSITKVGLARGTALTYSYPIFAALAGVVFLGEKLSPKKWIVVCVAVSGVYLTANGQFRFGGAFGPYEVLAVLGAMMAGCVIVVIKSLTRTESTAAIFCAQCAVGLWIVLVPSTAGNTGLGVMSGLIIIVAGVLAAVGQLLMTYSYKHVTASNGSLLSMLTPVLTILVGACCFGEELTRVSVLGMIIVLGACTVIIADPEK